MTATAQHTSAPTLNIVPMFSKLLLLVAAAGLTGNRDIVIPAESIVNFKLADDLVVQPAQ